MTFSVITWSIGAGLKPSGMKSGRISLANASQKSPSTNIQPTLDVLFLEAFEGRGVRVSRETGEGVGSLDFCFSHNLPDGKLLKVNLEVKLAHHKRIEHGLRRQLVGYLKANRSRHGVFLVLWFKDEKGLHFKQPAGTKTELLHFLQTASEDAMNEEGMSITPVLIDASIKESASI